MDFDLNEDQKEIKRVARELLSARSPWAKVRDAAEAGRYDQELWQEIIDLGWPGIAVAEEHGGQGLGAVELAVLAEELGYSCAASPLVPTAAAALAIQAAGNSEQQQRWLPGLASGELAGAIGTRERAADADPDRLPEGAALAAAAAAEAGREVTASAIQAHGGIGFTWEADVHWLYKRAQMDAALLGGEHRHRAALARQAASRVAPVGV